MGNPTPGIQWYNFRPPGVTPNRGMGPLWGAFCQITLTSCFISAVKRTELIDTDMITNSIHSEYCAYCAYESIHSEYCAYCSYESIHSEYCAYDNIRWLDQKHTVAYDQKHTSAYILILCIRLHTLACSETYTVLRSETYIGLRSEILSDFQSIHTDYKSWIY